MTFLSILQRREVCSVFQSIASVLLRFKRFIDFDATITLKTLYATRDKTLKFAFLASC